MEPRIGVFIPCYNVEKSISGVLSSFSDEVLSRVDELVAIENCSTDRTLQRLEEFKASAAPAARRLTVIKNSENRGLGGSQKIAFRYFMEKGFSHFMIIHGDNQGDGDAIAKAFLAEFDRNVDVDVIFASRFAPASDIRGYNLARNVGNRFFNHLTSALTGLKMSDAGTGIYFLRTDALRKVPFLSLTDSFQFNPELNLLFHEDQSLKVAVVPLSWRDSADASNIRSLKYCADLSGILVKYGFSKYILGKTGASALGGKAGLLSHRVREPKIIEKPWGKETLLELNDRYALKEIRMNQGTRSSLQSHSEKLETILVVEGKLELETVDDAGISRKEVFEAQGAYTIPPKTRHRVLALENCRLLEVSTPELDDVTRHQDDFGRS